ncbi:MAG TPA: HAMP domain-containing sensor histidine kinase [Aggregatilineaceae bacterium]|nr:HAMP domain-containing sensor histidine kinase [Aggregatilineaceae bacterium]
MNTKTQSVGNTDENGLRPTYEELSQNTRLLIRLRWVAGSGILLGVLLAQYVLQIDLPVGALLIVGCSVLGYNALLAFACQAHKLKTTEAAQRVALEQIVLDWLAMAALLHFTGGITSPALIYFVIHAALSGTIMLPKLARSLSVLVIVLVGGLALFESQGWLPHVALADLGLDTALYKNMTYILAVLFFFGTTVITLSELVTRKAQQLRQRQNQVHQLYEARSTFMRVATHELRAPLAAGISLMRNLEQGYAGPLSEQQTEIIHRVTGRLEHLRLVVDDLLTLAASEEASKAQIPLEPVNAREILEKIIEREMPNAENKHVRLDCHMMEDNTIVMSGDVGLGIIFGNLLNNAIKYTPENGCVRVGCTRAAHSIEVVFSDTGMGIPAEDLPQIFNEFFRARNAKNAQIIGSGLGLSTVRTLVERYQGTIALESEEGKGTTVKVVLPLASR